MRKLDDWSSKIDLTNMISKGIYGEGGANTPVNPKTMPWLYDKDKKKKDDGKEEYIQGEFDLKANNLKINPDIAEAPQSIRGAVPHGIIFKSGGPHIDSPYIDNLIKRNGQPMRIQDIKPGGPQLPWFLAEGPSSEQIRGPLKPWTTGPNPWTKEGGSWKFDNMPPFLQKQILKDASA